jgi:hypothetical protein
MVKIQEPLEETGSVPVALQDQTTEIVPMPLIVEINSGNLLSAPVAIDGRTMTLTAGHGAVVGNAICIFEDNRPFFAIIQSVVTNTITIDSPFDMAFSPAAYVCVGTANLNHNGAVTPVEASIGPIGNFDWDITRIHVNITDTTAMDSGKFGGQAALTNGVILRTYNGSPKNIFNAKTNGDLARAASNREYDPKAPAGVYGFASQHVLGGQAHAGVVIRLHGSTNDKISLIIQDNLTGLAAFSVFLYGHRTQA